MKLFKYQILLLFFLSAFRTESICQDTALLGKIKWDNYENKKNKLCENILIDSRKIEFIEDTKTVFLNNPYDAKLFKVNADVMVQLICNYGNPADNLYGFENFTFKILLIKNNGLEKEILDSIKPLSRSRYDYFTFDKTTTSLNNIDIQKDKTNSSSFITLTSSIRDFSSQNYLYIYYESYLLIITADINSKEIKIGNLFSFKENFTLINDKDTIKLR